MNYSQRLQSFLAEMDQVDTGGEPGSVWLHARYPRGRKNICEALRIDRADPAAAYATACFRCIETDDRNWIAGAVGAPPCLTVGDWQSSDITDVILWHPPTGDVRILGEAAKIDMIILPFGGSETLTVFAEPWAFFRAWADKRAAFLAQWQTAKAGRHALLPREPRDGNIPGAIVVGDVAKAWREVDAPVVEAGPGVDAKTLKSAIFRAARLPRVVEASRYRRAA